MLLIPIFEGMDGHMYETQARKAKFLEIGTFPAGSFCFVAPQAFSIDDDFTPGPFKGKVGLYLAANKFSFKLDPIDWDTHFRYQHVVSDCMSKTCDDLFVNY